MSEQEVLRPSDEGVDPWFLLGYLRATLLAGESITVDVWNKAVAITPEGPK